MHNFMASGGVAYQKIYIEEEEEGGKGERRGIYLIILLQNHP